MAESNIIHSELHSAAQEAKSHTKSYFPYAAVTHIYYLKSE